MLSHYWRSIQVDGRLRLIKNFSFLLGANSLNRITSLVIMVLIGRRLGPLQLGDYALGMAWAAIAFQFFDLGLSIVFRRDVARNPGDAPHMLARLMPLYVLLLTGGTICIFAIGQLAGYSTGTQVVLFGVAIAAVIDRFAILIMSVFEANESMEFVTICVGARSLFVVLFGSAYLLLDGNIHGLIAILIFGALIELLLSYVLLSRFYFQPSWISDIHYWKTILADSYPLAFTGLFVIIYYRIDTIMIQSIIGEEATGYYNAAYTLLGGFTIFSVALNRSLFARLANFEQNPEATRRMLYRGLLIVGISGFCIAAIVSSLAEPLVSMLFGSEFLGKSDLALSVLIWTLPFSFMSGLSGTFLNSTNRHKVAMWITAGIAIVNVVLNLAFIPQMGIVGASLTTVMSYVLGLIVMYLYLHYRVFGPMTATRRMP